MIVRIKGEEGIILKIDSIVSGGRSGRTYEMIYSVDAYQVTIMQAHGKEITFKCVYPSEIEPIGTRIDRYPMGTQPAEEVKLGSAWIEYSGVPPAQRDGYIRVLGRKKPEALEPECYYGPSDDFLGEYTHYMYVPKFPTE